MSRGYAWMAAVIVMIFFAAPAESKPEIINSKHKPSMLIFVDKDHGKTFGEFMVFVKSDGNWKKAGALAFGKKVTPGKLDLSKLLPAKGPVQVKLVKKGGGAAHVDYISVSGHSPSKVNGAQNKTALRRLAARDHNMINGHKGPVEFEFPLSGGGASLDLAARIEPEKIPFSPFVFPTESAYKPIDEDSAFYLYRLGSTPGALSMTGDTGETEKAEPFFKEFSLAGSGHPDGDTVIWVRDDGEHLYAVYDFTIDNTVDEDFDFAAVHVKTSDGVKEFKARDTDTRWGRGHFIFTNNAPWEHRYYEFKIPLSELGVKKQNEKLALAFSAYGTGNITAPVNGSTIDFGTANIGAPVNNLVTITHSDPPTNWTNTVIGGADAADFGTLANGTCANVAPPNLALNPTCTFSVVFTASSAGAKTGTMTLSAALGADVVVNLTGTGRAPVAEPTPDHALSVSVSGDGSGTVTSSPAGISCPSACSAYFEEGTVVTLSASEGGGSSFAAWGGACAGTWRGDPCSVTMAASASATAVFDPQETGGGNGDGGGSSGGGNGNGGSSPPAPGLGDPPDGANLPGTDVTFTWTPGTARHYETADATSYELYVCQREDFEGCDAIQVASVSDHSKRFAALQTTGAAVFGLMFIGALGFKRGRIALLTFMLASSLTLAACSSSDSTDEAETTGGAASYTMTGLLPNTTYWWKIIAISGGGGRTESPVRSFTTGS